MRLEKRISRRNLVAAVLLCLFCASQTPAQSAGNNAVYTGSPTAALTGSSAYIDATAWAGTTSTDFCDAVNQALHAAAGTAAVIDARGLNSTNTSMSCAGTKTPWSAGFTITSPSTILLPPAGTGITIAATWVLPDKTRVIGAGRTTTSIAVASGYTPTTMIQMGSTVLCPNGCTGVAVSDLKLDGKGIAVTGILNQNSKDGSYVSHVTFSSVEATSLDIETSGANNSGPYTDLTPSAGASATTSTACIKIVNAQTKGIHGFTCTANGNPYAGIYLSASGNTIEDGHFEGVVDGIAVGATASATGNTIQNISGASGSGPLTNVLHICCNSPCSGIYLDGIDNLNAEEQSYVDDVTIQNVEGTGLYLGQDSGGRVLGAADHSGPYTNIIFQQATPCTGCMTQTSTACVNVYSGVQPRGIYGITCTADTTPAAAIILDGSNVTIENARLDGFTDGILIGDHPVAGQGLAQADLLFNVLSANSTGNTTANLIHICCSPPSSSTPVNVTVLGATSAAGNTIKDELTSTTLTNSSDPHVGLYVLGHPIYNSSSVIEGYSRFSTSPRFPAWIVGSTTAAISGSCSNGSLFSSTNGTGGTLWTCVSTSWSKIQ